MAVKVSWPISGVCYEKGREETVTSQPLVFKDCSYFRYVEEGPHRKSDRQAQQVMSSISGITEGEGGDRFTSDSTGEISGMG